MTDNNEWHWWSSRDEENYDGPFNSRAAAVAELDGEPGWVCEAYQAPLRLADFIDVELMLERAEECAEEYTSADCDPIFDPKPDQTADLESRIKRACNEWQDAHGIKFMPWSFSGMRNKERIE